MASVSIRVAIPGGHPDKGMYTTFGIASGLSVNSIHNAAKTSSSLNTVLDSTTSCRAY